MEQQLSTPYKFKHEYTLLFFLSAMLTFGACYHHMRYFDFPQAYDSITYWALSHFDFHQSPIRRYRVIVPILARGVSEIYMFFIRTFNLELQDEKFPLKFSYMVVNTCFISGYITLIYRFCRTYGLQRFACFVAAMFVLTSYTTMYVTGSALVDSFFWFLILLMLVGIREQKDWMIYTAIFLGPFAKESFIFFVPVMFFFSKVPKIKQIGALILSGAIIFSFRYFIDKIGDNQATESAHFHLQYVIEFFDTIGAMYHMYVFQDFMETFGIWLLALIACAVLIKRYFKRLKPYWNLMAWTYFLMVIVQMWLSGDFARMFYLNMPFFALIVAATIGMLQEDKVIPVIEA